MHPHTSSVNICATVQFSQRVSFNIYDILSQNLRKEPPYSIPSYHTENCFPVITSFHIQTSIYYLTKRGRKTEKRHWFKKWFSASHVTHAYDAYIQTRPHFHIILPNAFYLGKHSCVCFLKVEWYINILRIRVQFDFYIKTHTFQEQILKDPSPFWNRRQVICK